MKNEARNSFSRMAGAVVLAALVPVLAAACRPSQTVEQQTKDAAIEAQVKAKLATDVGAASVTAVEVNVTNGVVTLAGPVSTEDERQRAEAAARSVEGVTGVNNNLQVTTTGVIPSPAPTLPPGAEVAMTPLSGAPMQSPTEAVPTMTTPPASR